MSSGLKLFNHKSDHEDPTQNFHSHTFHIKAASSTDKTENSHTRRPRYLDSDCEKFNLYVFDPILIH
jgi:hypothetical protein